MPGTEETFFFGGAPGNPVHVLFLDEHERPPPGSQSIHHRVLVADVQSSEMASFPD